MSARAEREKGTGYAVEKLDHLTLRSEEFL